MALFSKKTKEKAVEPKKENKTPKTSLAISKAEVKVGIPGFGVTFTLKPRVTEKSAMLSENNVYTFEVPQDASKGAISKAVSAIWKVHPVKVSIVKTKGKKKFARGKMGRKNDMKKAYVYLKKGEKIELGN